MARNGYLVLKGKLNVYKKLLNDDLRDANSRRKEKRGINQGQMIVAPVSEDKKLLQKGPKTPVINMQPDDGDRSPSKASRY